MKTSTDYTERFRIYCTTRDDDQLHAIEYRAENADRALKMAHNAGWIVRGVPECLRDDSIDHRDITLGVFFGIMYAAAAFALAYLVWHFLL